MNDLLTEIRNHVFILTLNRTAKRNAFDDTILKALQRALDNAITDPDIRVILLKANGTHFCAGADLSWMHQMAGFSEDENKKDAMVLARLMKTLHDCPKPTIALVQGCAFGGGAGLAAACDMVCAADNARFCFSEVKLGLIPAVISPYVIKAIGERAATHLFMTADIFSAERAHQLQLVHYITNEAELEPFGLQLAEKLAKSASHAISACKSLVRHVASHPLNNTLVEQTALLIAQLRVSEEGQTGLRAFLNKTTPQWN